jgi:antimicrobial peptide system SdpA family protein
MLAATRVASTAVWSVLALFVLSGSVEDSPLRASARTRLNLLALCPQGWSFFTRDPREPVDRVYRRQGTALAYSSVANGSLANLLGLRRAARAINVELAGLLAGVPEGRWRDCRQAVEKCVEPGADAIVVENRALVRSLCGELVIERRPPVPWAWSGSPRPVDMPARILLLRAECGE